MLLNRLIKKLHVHWWHYDGFHPERGARYRCRCSKTAYGVPRSPAPKLFL